MATNYPGGLDSLTNPSAGDALTSPSHSAQHANANDAIEAIETELGTTPSGSETTVAARLTAIEAGTNLGTNSVTADKIAANAVGASELADSAVDTNAIADSAVTPAKMQRQVGNLLTDAQASVSSTGLFTLTGCTEGAAGVYTASSTGVAFGYILPAGLPVTAGETYTALATLATVGRTANVRVEWLNSGGSIISFVSGSTVAAGATAVSSVTAVAPAGSVTARFYPFITGSGSAGNTVTVTNVSFHRGAAGVWSLPGVPVVGQSGIAVNNAVHLSGTGAPEGVITAAPGSTWLQTDSTVDVKGWIRWVKATGTGNTGWIAGPEADTGVRNLAAESLSNSWAVSGSLFKLSRVGRTVDIDATFTKASASSDTVYTLPAGFRPQQATVSRVCRTDTADDFVTVSITSAGVITIPRSSMTSNVVYANLSFVCPTTAPTSLPGS